MVNSNDFRINPYPLGVHVENGAVRFSFVSKKKDCGVLIYDKKTGKRLQKLPFENEERIGNIHCKVLNDIDVNKISYQFYEEDRIVPDRYARMFVPGIAYGKERKTQDLKALIPEESFDWQGDVLPKIPYNESLCYCAHVRGFTKHASSKVSGRGTFQGMLEKIDYLKEIGVTTVELQPVYEFTEIPTVEERRDSLNIGKTGHVTAEADLDQLVPKKCNYWGYKHGYYYAPKAAYAATSDACKEFKELVRAFHKAGLELVMQFYFPKTVKTLEITDILKYWVLEYHVDGFHLMGENLPVDLIAADEMLSDTKLWYYYFNADALYDNEETPEYTNLAVYNDEYLYTLRKYLKGDENMLDNVIRQMRTLPVNMGRIHYMSNYFGMTLMDLVSYERKHNENNGEDNRDGNDFNYSWNCGEEGSSRRKKINQLRHKQIKNAMFLLLFSQSTPLIFMGDEFGNSQKGNNNPYCQDNGITWLDWNDRERNADILAFWKEMVALRKAHKVLHPAQACKIMDYISCGYPDLSYHGDSAWRPRLDSYNRHIGVMYCGKYAEDDFVYLAYNMYWEQRTLAMPKLPQGMKWKLVTSTEVIPEKETVAEGNEAENPSDLEVVIPARSCAMYLSVPDESEHKKSRKGKKQDATQYGDRTMF